jgi:NAD(P)-dependent dehydrogenase (short-subunit alcohol dehydrogenase family)
MKGTPFDLTGRTALITGGSKGIGYAIATGFARAGADLFLCSRNEETLQAAAERLRAATGVRVECGHQSSEFSGNHSGRIGVVQHQNARGNGC